MNKWILIALVGVAVIVIGSFILNSQPATEDSYLDSPTILAQDLSNFAVISEPLPLKFPEDQAAHPEFLSEWWYYTGNLFTPEGRQFSYQLTFFRRAIGNPAGVERVSSWATNQVYFAHFALIDVEAQDHQAWEVFSRGAVGLAGAVSLPVFEVWLNDWEVKQTGQNQYRLYAAQDDIILDLTLQDQKGFILHGDQGMSQKGPQIGNASMYFSQTRLITEGQLKMQEQTFQVSGLSWMDQEFGTSALGKEQIGWDWFSIQLDNQSELMIFQIREKTGSISEESGGSWIAPDGRVDQIHKQDFELTPLNYWKNPDGIDYPIEWEISLPLQEAKLTIKAVLPNQENRFSFFQYWEGAIRVDGVMNGNPVSGWGFLEMTGYGQDMSGLF